MNKRRIRFVGLDKKGKDVRLLEVGYDMDKEEYRITILSSIGKTIATVQMSRNEIIEPLKWLNRFNGGTISRKDCR